MTGEVIGATFRPGVKGSALYLDGADDYVRMSQKAFDRISALPGGTISFWFKFESLLDTQSIMPIFYLGMADERDSDNILIIEVGHFKQGQLRERDPGNKRLYSTFIRNNGHPFLCLDSGRSMEEGRWMHYALVSAPGGTNVFINGEGVPDSRNFGRKSDRYFMRDVPNTEVLFIGKGKTSSMVTPGFVFYKGMIDELRVYDRPLEPEEIRLLMNDVPGQD